ncbi:hypothetical protein [Arthrobacter sp. YD2]|uniref:hypothetical protein n=1 Tax=Arthrobacter sp. YD2 TaxID=3058046 RepID=UPI0025B424C6|nr:hypothetical protein [Arthrobacter sp. YD2]MDN3904255.1 hypothetical protein [Arthrobacter sp. YD2]
MHIRKTHRTAFVTGIAVLAGLSVATGAPALATGTGQPNEHPTAGTSTPAQDPSPGTPFQETGIYLYEKKDKDQPAAWENSGPQTLLDTQVGHRWFTDITALLPVEVCGDGWAVQQDQLESPGAIAWPDTITYPEGFPGNVTLVEAKHQELADVALVPACGPTEQPSPSPSTPSDKPSEPSKPGEPGEPPTGTPTPTGSATPTPTGTAPAPKGTATPTPTGSPTTNPAAPPATKTPAGASTPDPGTTEPGSSGPGSSGPAGTDTSATDPALAATGADGLFPALAGAGILGLGTAVVLLTRRRGNHS